MGFKEMSGDMIVSSFWNFDALFQPQDHPAREMQDTFFLDKESPLPDKSLVKAVKEAHEKGVNGSKGWQYNWNEREAKKLVLRTHTTCLSAQTLAGLKKQDLPAKFFAIGKCFRNETVDWSHGFEFNQTEGIVIDRNANFIHLLGYLKEFFSKMGFEKIKFIPSYFPYTEPSVEIRACHPEKKIWLELGGAGIFRPEVVIPLLGENIPVLAWGPGFDRLLMDYYKIADLREFYKNDITQLRNMRFWMK
jgi:phenylalanyl-tRNA synthetase alpha chain